MFKNVSTKNAAIPATRFSVVTPIKTPVTTFTACRYPKMSGFFIVFPSGLSAHKTACESQHEPSDQHAEHDEHKAGDTFLNTVGESSHQHAESKTAQSARNDERS